MTLLSRTDGPDNVQLQIEEFSLKYANIYPEKFNDKIAFIECTLPAKHGARRLELAIAHENSAPTAENAVAFSWCFSLDVLGLVFLLYLGFCDGWRRDGVPSNCSGSWDLDTSTSWRHTWLISQCICWNPRRRRDSAGGLGGLAPRAIFFFFFFDDLLSRHCKLFSRGTTATRLECEGWAFGLISQYASVCDTFTFLQVFFFSFLPSSLLSCWTHS